MAIADNLALVKSRITAACETAGRQIDNIRLLPMSKGHSSSDILAAHQAGLTRFGENRPQELAVKAAELAEVELDFAFAGHLQTNKAKIIAAFAAEFQALDSLRLAAELDKQCQRIGRELPVLVEVNTSNEPQKHGIAPADAIEFAHQLAVFDSLKVNGLMTMAVLSPDRAQVAACFDTLVETQRRLQDCAAPGSWEELSMGMSGDFELAIAKGATCIRIGTAIFGKRN
ncbi:MAG: YggS family pyridoxal phosphate-dependent enzyme [Propionibacterium sp.]|nr:MAG: YggS family pyridoxal phosphate-dependent enzyme [Propionibacterium sp.]